ncbi:MAG: hypothetical protein QM780_02390 [Hyphomicrobium sp.]|uniref:hypothetical protein n=1 Tax=Hyphomicrobium sp. TaxID=82 RepID=UPI0039E32EE0
MTYLLLQTFLLLLASYFLGAFVACVVKRAFFGTHDEVPAHAMAPGQVDVPPVVVPPQPIHPRVMQPSLQQVAPRAIDPVQPKIEVLRRPEPRPLPAVLDPSRFERALLGPSPNEGVPRIAIAEIRPSVLPPVTDIYVPPPPEPPPPVEEIQEEPAAAADIPDLEEPEVEPAPEPEPRKGGLAARLRDATTAAAAGAVAAAKAAAAASVGMPGIGSLRRSPVKESDEETPTSEPEDIPSEGSAHADEPKFLDETTEDVFGHATDDTPEEPAQSEPPQVIEPEPARESKPVVQAPVVPAALIEGGDDFQRIRAIDSDIEQKLKARGVTYFEHIAGWGASDIKRIGQELEIPGRIDREQWVEQAQILAKGGETYYSRNRKAMLSTRAAPLDAEKSASADQTKPSVAQESKAQPSSAPATGTALQTEEPSGVAAASQGRSVAEMAAAAAAAIAAASASVTRGLKPIEPISPLSKVDPKISMPARITDAIREKEMATATVEIAKENPAPETGGDGPSDDLKRIRGIGVLIEKRLNAMGIRRYEQIANWTSGDIDRVSRMLEFKGRIERESWVEQARILASGGQTEFSRRVDRGEVDTSRES